MMKYVTIWVLWVCWFNGAVLGDQSQSASSTPSPSVSAPPNLRASPTQQLPNSQKLTTKYNLQIYLDTRDTSETATALKNNNLQYFAIPEIEYFVSQNNSVLCVGAHVGLEALIAGKLVGGGGKVVVCEGYSFWNSLMVGNRELNGFSERMEIYEIVASDRQQTLYLQVNYSNPSNLISYLSEQPSNPQTQIYIQIQQVKTDLLDQLLDGYKFDFVLVELPGREIQVLMGMKGLIADARNLVIMVKFCYNAIDQIRDSKSKWEAYWVFLGKIGYSFYRSNRNASSSEFKADNLQKIDSFFSLFQMPTPITLIFLPEFITQSLHFTSSSSSPSPSSSSSSSPSSSSSSSPSPSPSSSFSSTDDEQIPQQHEQSNNNTQYGPQYFCYDKYKQMHQVSPYNKQSRLQLVATIYGFKMYVDGEDGSISMRIKKYGTWQPYIAAIISRLVKAGDHVLNLGSQSGMQSIIMGKRVGPNGHLSILEPYSLSFQMVSKNIHLNNLQNITDLYNFGASNQISQGSIHIQYANTGGSRISSITNKTKNQVQTVNLRPVDSLLPAQHQLDFALIDVEWMEGQAILGMKEIIKRSPNLILLVEWSYRVESGEYKSYAKQAAQFLFAQGYHAYEYKFPADLCSIGIFSEMSATNFFNIRRVMDIYFFPSTIPIVNGRLPSTFNSQKLSPKTIEESSTQEKGEVMNKQEANQQEVNEQKENKQKFNYLCVPSGQWHQSKPLNLQSEERQQLVNTKYGFDMYVDSKDKLVSQQIAYSGDWQPKYISAIAHLLKPGDHILNLGSQSGLQAIIMGKLIGQKGLLYIFQPYSISNKILNKNMEINNLTDRATIYKLAAADQNGKAYLNIMYSNTGGSTVSKLKDTKSTNQQQQIQLKRVDDVIPAHIKLDFALIDVQRMQAQALLGMRDIIMRSPNLVMMIEWNYPFLEQQAKQKAREAVKMLEENNFRFFVYYYKSACEIGRFTEISWHMVLGFSRVFDVFVFPASHDAPYLQRLSKPQQILTTTSKEDPNLLQQQSIQITVPYQKLPSKFNYKCVLKRISWKSSKSLSTDGGRLQEVQTRYGFNMYVDRQDKTVSQNIARAGTWQPYIINMIGFFVEEGDVVLNLGSQSGLEAIIMGTLIGQKGHLYIFQPYSFSYKMVKSNIMLNGLINRTTIYKRGASDHNETAKIRVSYGNTGGSMIVSQSMQSGNDNRFNEVEQVYLRRVDEVLPANISIDFALIDVERMEGRAITGMKQIIQNSPNLVIFVEWNYPVTTNEDKNISNKLIDYLTDKGYRYYRYMGKTQGCDIGEFSLITPNNLLSIRLPMDILMIPKDLPFPTSELSPKKVRQTQNQKKIEETEIFDYQNQYCYAKVMRNWRQTEVLDRSELASRAQLVSTLYGFKMYIDKLDQIVSQNIYAHGTWQPLNINIMLKLVKPGNKVVNIGSQTGLQAIIMGKIIGETGRLFVFEPYSESNRLVIMNIQLNNLQNITTIYKKGAYNQTANGSILVDYYNTGGSEIRANQLSAHQKARKHNEIESVQLERADVLLPKQLSFDFILMDVEKMEVQALQGMKQVFERSPNLVLIVQWSYLQNSHKSQLAAREVLLDLQNRGYRFYLYTGLDYSCDPGTFSQKSIADLLKIAVADVFMFPSSVEPPRK